jgi:putative ABC transport system substrate-binding protein
MMNTYTHLCVPAGSTMKGMNTKTFIAAVVVFLIAAAGVFYLLSQEKEQKTYRIGILSGLDFFADTADGFISKMNELGYEEGKNVFYDIQKTNFDMDVYRKILEGFARDRVDLVFVFPTEASIEAKIALEDTGIPTVFANAFTDGTGLVQSVREPGGNITGVRWAGPEIALQRFEIMRELIPGVMRLFVPYQRGYPIVQSQLDALHTAAVTAGITIVEMPADNIADLRSQLQVRKESLQKDRDAIMVIAEPLMVTPDAFMEAALFAREKNILFGGALFMAGGYESAFGVVPKNVPQGEQAAVLADKILRGSRAGSIPVVSAESYLQINYRELQRLGIPASESLLRRASEVIR